MENQCREAIQFGLHGVCVPGSRVTDARHFLEDSALKVACAIGYPFGTSDADAKRYEIEAAVDAGAQEIELVPSFARLLDGQEAILLRELRDSVEAAEELPVAVVLETSLLKSEQALLLCQLAEEAGAKAVKWMAGFGAGVLDIEKLKVARGQLDSKVEFQAAALVLSLDDALKLTGAGAAKVAVPVVSWLHDAG